MQQPPRKGELFRRNYVHVEAPLADSLRARHRVLSLFGRTGRGPAREKFPDLVRAELGIPYPFMHMGWNHEEFWTEIDVADFLSAITLWFRILSSERAEFLQQCRGIFSEEHLRYTIDDACAAHFSVDQEFERLVGESLAGLGDPRFAAARHALDAALESLGPIKQSGKALIRGVFEAVESAFLVVISRPTVLLLNAQSIDAHLKPILLTRYKAEPDAADKVERLLVTFKAWVKGAHPFRHGAPLDQIHEAPLDLALLSATQGMGYLRYLASL